ncbi:uncharacterized protein LOC141695823 [Apium graveolens]|uniref:uncharacterized protein LOC141695823 n=1 Tax=Apium graveolens TaxID=4045 RepID=UPI003D7AD257
MKVLRQGYYWPTIKEHATNFVKACDRCQRFANYSFMPATLLTRMASPWPFAIWGIDLIGELPKAKGDVKFGIPYKLVSNNGKQFDSKDLRQLCEELKIKKEFIPVYHPQSNG